MDVTFVLDVSDGVSTSEYNQVIEVAIDLTEQMRTNIRDDTRQDGIQVASVSSGGTSRVDFYLGRYATAVDIANEFRTGIPHRGGDNVLEEALLDVVQLYGRRQTFNPNLVIIITNGNFIPVELDVLLQKYDMEPPSNDFYFYTVYINTNGNYLFVTRLATNGVVSSHQEVVDFRDFRNYHLAAREACFGCKYLPK